MPSSKIKKLTLPLILTLALPLSIVNAKTQQETKSNSDETKTIEPKLEQLMTKAYDLCSEDTQACINAYKQAIILMDKNPEIKDDYYYLYAHYMLMIQYPQLSENTNFPEEEYNNQTIHYAKKALQIVEPIFVYAHFTEIGLFHEEVIRLSSNAIAWHSLTSTDNPVELQKLLDQINRGCEFAMNSGSELDTDYLHIHDTKVAVLMKMGKTDDAFKLLWQMQKADKSYEDFAGFAKSEAYQQWLKKKV